MVDSPMSYQDAHDHCRDRGGAYPGSLKTDWRFQKTLEYSGEGGGGSKQADTVRRLREGGGS